MEYLSSYIIITELQVSLRVPYNNNNNKGDLYIYIFKELSSYPSPPQKEGGNVRD